MIINVKDLLEYISDHGLYHKYTVVDNYKWYWIVTEEINNECWFNVFYNPDYKYISLEYCFSSMDVRECLDFCNILYYG